MTTLQKLRQAASALPRIFAAFLTAASMMGAAQADPHVGVSINVGQPGFYGRVNIGHQAPPVIYQQPIIIQQSQVASHRRPIYLRVPQGHSNNWSRHCGRYSACGQPVYFVKYSDRMAPRHHHRRQVVEHHHHHHHHDRGPRHGHRDHHRDGRGHHGHDHRR